MDRLVAMKTFVRVVERGSFSAVAKEFGATQSAVSKQVAALEARLGAKLLVRSTRAIALTRAGEAFFPEARRLSEEVQAAEAMARANERKLDGAFVDIVAEGSTSLCGSANSPTAGSWRRSLAKIAGSSSRARTIFGPPGRSLARKTWPRTPASSTPDRMSPAAGRSRGQAAPARRSR